ncbi:fibronectin type III domain-containing protein [Listeria monocytogenes]|uniref:fibronectin type III domain-containing protein n=1 Tax=Listeria monocytogenes TaxID=1639 RepID=UPI001ECC92F7|nr:fibronectin type III domain-containing protein [Listeria monocytogenes]
MATTTTKVYDIKFNGNIVTTYQKSGSYKIDNLAPDTNYQIQVRTRTKTVDDTEPANPKITFSGVSEWTAPINVKTQESAVALA